MSIATIAAVIRTQPETDTSRMPALAIVNNGRFIMMEDQVTTLFLRARISSISSVNAICSSSPFFVIDPGMRITFDGVFGNDSVLMFEKEIILEKQLAARCLQV